MKPNQIAAVLLMTMAGSALAQQSTLTTERQRLLQDSTVGRAASSAERHLELPKSGDRNFEVGGWISNSFFDFENDDHTKVTRDPFKDLFISDRRVWMSKEFGDDFQGYLRIRDIDMHYSTSTFLVAGIPTPVPQPNTNSEEGLELDLAFVDYVPAKDHWRARLGRQFKAVGRGLVLAMDLDGINVEYQNEAWTGRVFAGESLRRTPNIDQSILGANNRTQDRDFFVGEIEYRAENTNRYYAYAMAQDDNSRSLNPFQAVLPFRYDSNYVGAGTEGRFNLDLHYFAEVVHEGGRMMAQVVGTPRVRIDATGFTSGLLYYPKWGGFNPLLSAEYSFGSGDAARGSVTNTFGGKSTATTDQNFLYFGVFDGGLALAPRLSNIEVLRLGIQGRPLPKLTRELPELVVGAKYNRYWKDKAASPMSDPLSFVNSKDVGDGFDVFAASRLLSDVTAQIQYGYFDPGSAYPGDTRTPSERLLVSSTIEF